jgi:hypothetical protein
MAARGSMVDRQAVGSPRQSSRNAGQKVMFRMVITLPNSASRTCRSVRPSAPVSSAGSPRDPEVLPVIAGV